MALGGDNYQNDSEEMIFSWRKTASEGSFSMQHYDKSHWLLLLLLFEKFVGNLPGQLLFISTGRGGGVYLLQDVRCRQITFAPRSDLREGASASGLTSTASPSEPPLTPPPGHWQGGEAPGVGGPRGWVVNRKGEQTGWEGWVGWKEVKHLSV